MNAAEIIVTLQAPTPASEIRWLPTVKKPSKWMWTAYISGDYMRRKILQVSPAHDVRIISTWMDGECRMVRVEITLHGDDRDITVAGIAGAEPKRNVSAEKRWKAAKTGAAKNAMLELGLGLDLHGRTKWTKPDQEPKQNQRPASTPTPTPATAPRPEVIEERETMTSTEFWTAIRRMKISQSLTREVLARHNMDFTAALSELATLAPPAV